MTNNLQPKKKKDGAALREAIETTGEAFSVGPGKPLVLRAVQPASPSTTQRVEVDFKHLDDGRVVELVEDPADEKKTKLAVFDNGKVYLTDAVDYRGQLLVPTARTADGLEDISLPRGLYPYKSAEAVFYAAFHIIQSCVALPGLYSLLTAAIVLNSWFADRLRPPVYLLLTGLPQSGKTTLLETLRLLCRRSLLVSDISSAAAFDACSRFGCTLLIDENDWRADQNSRALRKQLRAGTSKGLRAKHLRKTQHTYGTKVLSGVELPEDAALRSRCIHLPMNETDRTDLRKPWDEQIVRAADCVRGQLLQFRLEQYASISPRIIPGAENLRPRSRDLLSSLLGPLEGAKPMEDVLLEFFIGVHDPSTRDLLSPEQSAVVAALFEMVHNPAKVGFVQVGAVAGLANQILDATGERFMLNPRGTSNILTGMGFCNRSRSNRGALVSFDKETIAKIHRLKRIHAVQWPESEGLKAQSEACSFCNGEPSSTSTESDG
jgi:hypothetical protein